MKCNPLRWLWGVVPILLLGWIAMLAERGRIETDLASRTKTVLERNGLGWAEVSFEGRDAVLAGKATEEDDPAKAVAAVLDTMGVRVVENRAALIDKVDHYQWSATRGPKAVRLEGFVPSDKVRAQIIKLVKDSVSGVEIEDKLKAARGVPPLNDWLGGIGFGLKQLAGLKDGRVELEQLNLSVAGDASDARSYRAVKTALAGKLPQAIKLKSEAVRPPLAKPYVWTARRVAKEVVLAGHVPNDGVREELLRLAQKLLPGVAIVDRMEPASGAPDGFQQAATATIEQLAVLETGEAQLSDRSLTISGMADTAAHADGIKGAMGRGVLASFKANGDIQHREPLIKTISPYETAAMVEGGRVVLSGYVPDDRAREAFVASAKARFPGRNVVDEMQLGAGQPPDWATCMDSGLEALRQLGNGRVGLNGRRLLVTGTTGAEPLAQSLPGSVAAQARNACDTDVRVTLVLAAAQAQADAKKQADEAAQKAAQAEADRRHADEMKRVEEAKRAEEARRAEDARRTAQAKADEERRRAEEAARAKVAEASRPKPTVEQQKNIDECQQALSQVTREGVINFERASYKLETSSYPTLNKLALAANRCPKLVVEIEGHTDAEGTVERNQLLSDRRANAVRDYLVKAGVDGGRLIAIGYGATHNIAPNDTAEGRAKNRRIDFLVKLP